MELQRIPVFRPLIGDQEIEAATQSLREGWLGMGKSVGQFEAELLKYVGAKDRHCVAVNTGHAALHLALLLVGCKPGDEVITPSFNNIADFQAILATGATPVLCDIRDDTLCIDLEKAKKLIGQNTKAIIIMDYDCCLVDYAGAARLAEDAGIRIIHDAAHSLGSRHEGRPIGSFSDICMFSFDPVKSLTCIDGGALIVRNEAEVERLHQMRLIGMGQPAAVMYGNQRAWTYDVKEIGYRYHMANLHAAIGLAQLSQMETISETRRAACRRYNEVLSGIDEVQTPHSDFTDITPFLYYIRVPENVRQPLRDFLQASGIDTGIHWQPGHWFTLLKDAPRGDLSVTDRVGSEILSLPLHSMMGLELVDRIGDAIKKFFAQS